jgi:hypothetical protein
MKTNGFNAETQRTQSNAKANFSLRPSASPRLGVEKASRHPPLATRHSQRGVALIITLILLSVVLFMAITFLALSRRERNAVATVTDTAGARLAADAALANAEAQIVANALSTTNPYNFGLLVSTNYINPAGFDSANLNPFENINYDHQLNSSTPLTQIQFLTLLTNLWYSPRPPVFIPTNATGGNDFRFYLDLNRNGQFDANGMVTNVQLINGSIVIGGTISEVGDPEWIGVLERPDAPYGPNNKFIARYAFIAVPVGNALDLNAIHNQAHRGLPSLPVNPTVNPPPPPAGNHDDVFIRNESVGSWEINLAAFLADLNTNEWGQDINQTANYYQYNEAASGLPNRGLAFDDARALLAYRYANNFNTLGVIGTLPNNLFGTPGVNAFKFDNLDGYTYGYPGMMTGFKLPFPDNDFTLIGNGVPWVGADNTNHFFTHQELFDATKVQNPYASPVLGFTDRLLQAGTNTFIGTNIPTYDRYTFYRLLSQLGTDTTPDSGKMNLNYVNVDTNGNVVPGMETNFVSWTNALQFFTNAGDRLLRAYTTQWRNGNPTNFATAFYAVTNFNFINTDQWTNYPAFGIGNIPVLVSNQFVNFVYSSAVNRLLQLAANLYDATTNKTFALGNNYPSVFRPTFRVINQNGYNNVYINGYTDVSRYSSQFGLTVGSPPLDLPVDVSSPLLVPNASVNALHGNVYGVPWIIGAKKGFPNFNEFSMESIVQTTRKLQVTRDVTNQPPQATHYQTNQMYVFSITNSIGVECWNSYSNNYLNTVQIVLNDTLLMALTNLSTTMVSGYYSISIVTNVTLWPGSIWGYNALDPNSPNPFIIPLQTNVAFLPASVYKFASGTFIPATDNTPWETITNIMPSLNPLPHFGLVTSNRFQLFMLDGTAPNVHVIDYVQFAGPDSLRDINAELTNPDLYDPYGMWQTNLLGLQNQLNLSKGTMVPDAVPTEDGGQWKSPAPGLVTIPQQQAYFQGLFMTNNKATVSAWPDDPDDNPQATETNASHGTQAPYTPTRTVVQYLSWQANDPLVHYIASDLNYSGNERGVLATGTTNSDRAVPPILPDLGNVNDRYEPWGTLAYMGELANVSTNPFELAFKDPLMWQPDDWDFPTNKFPTVGWIGRVHRGTPWQTVYLKATSVLRENGGIGTNTWAQWTGDTQLTFNQYFDAANSAPARDRLLLDLFTTAFNDNATRGTLSVNVGATNGPSLAAWSALFSGMVVLTNTAVAPNRVLVPPTSYTNLIINPAGSAGLASPLGQLVQGINAMRATFTNADGLAGAFEHVGDILSTPQLTEQSPFLNWNNSLQQQEGISDEVYEWLPQQTMSLLRCSGSPRYVIYCYGQTLKPAPNGIYNGGAPFFGMITNYQVVSEIATRAVVRFNSTVTNVVTFTPDAFGNPIWFTAPVVTNNNAVIESFNILPPD